MNGTIWRVIAQMVNYRNDLKKINKKNKIPFHIAIHTLNPFLYLFHTINDSIWSFSNFFESSMLDFFSLKIKK